MHQVLFIFLIKTGHSNTSIRDPALACNSRNHFLKLATMCRKCIYAKASSYLITILKLCTPSHHLRSSSDSKLFVTPSLKLKMFGESFFSSCSLITRISIPKDLRETASLDTFDRRLKTIYGAS